MERYMNAFLRAEDGQALNEYTLRLVVFPIFF
jgi:hypothetical protein